ncbi:hypothetical protein GCM10009608_33210 [Pseudonocardia alaniniphila]
MCQVPGGLGGGGAQEPGELVAFRLRVGIEAGCIRFLSCPQISCLLGSFGPVCDVLDSSSLVRVLLEDAVLAPLLLLASSAPADGMPSHPVPDRPHPVTHRSHLIT